MLVVIHTLLAMYKIPAILLQVIGITSVPHPQVLTAKHPVFMIPLMTSALKAGDYQHEVNKVVLEATPPLSPLYIAGTTSMARSASLAPTVTGGLLLRTLAPVSTT